MTTAVYVSTCVAYMMAKRTPVALQRAPCQRAGTEATQSATISPGFLHTAVGTSQQILTDATSLLHVERIGAVQISAVQPSRPCTVACARIFLPTDEFRSGSVSSALATINATTMPANKQYVRHATFLRFVRGNALRHYAYRAPRAYMMEINPDPVIATRKLCATRERSSVYGGS